MIREWLKPICRQIESSPNWVQNSVARARKFVLDDDMSAFLADLSNASMRTCGTFSKAKMLTESLRSQARLPHALTWIEYNKRRYRARLDQEYVGDVNMTAVGGGYGVADRCGWLCIQHREIETAFMAVQCSSHAFDHNNRLIESPMPCVIGYVWRCDDDGALPWQTISPPAPRAVRESGETVDMFPESYVTGVVGYQSDRVGVVRGPHLKAGLVEQYFKTSQFNVMREMAGDLRCLWSLLATINDLPTRTTEVVQSRGFVARGRYRKFVDHRVITLTIPEQRYRRVAARAVAISRRRRYPVRGHYRVDWRLSPSPLCAAARRDPITGRVEHPWVSGPDGRLRCPHCRGEKIFVREHERGDAALGYVTHDYQVSRSAEV
jgi:hypothetical protein